MESKYYRIVRDWLQNIAVFLIIASLFVSMQAIADSGRAEYRSYDYWEQHGYAEELERYE